MDCGSLLPLSRMGSLLPLSRMGSLLPGVDSFRSTSKLRTKTPTASRLPHSTLYVHVH
jgi:hypothetical protein